MALLRRLAAMALAWSVLGPQPPRPCAPAAAGPDAAGPGRDDVPERRRPGCVERHGNGPSNRYITDLVADDFLVFENGVKQDIGYFSRTSLSLSVSLLLDSSASMEDKMRTTQEAASGSCRACGRRTRRR